MAELSVNAWWSIPPITRTLATAMFLISFLGNYWILPVHHLMYDPYFLTRMMPPQVWRLLTCFFITGPKLAILFDTYWLCTYLWHLEESHTRLSLRRADLAWYLLVVCGFIMGIAHLTGYIYPTMTEALITAICYTATQEQQGSRTHYLFFSIPTPFMPFIMTLTSFLMEQTYDDFVKHAMGLVAGHLYLFLTQVWPQVGGGRNILSTPSILSTLVGRKAGETRPGGFNMRQQDPAPPNMGPLPDSWAHRGRGQRLG